MKKWIILLCVVLIACAPPAIEESEEIIEKEPPKQQIVKEIVEKVVVQCEDGSTADSLEDCPQKETEEVEVKEVETVPDEKIAQQLLNDAKDKFTGLAYLLGDRMVITRDNKIRHYFLEMGELDDKTPITDVYVDLDKQTAVAYCNIEREGRTLDRSFDYDRSECKDYIDKEIPTSFSAWNIKGPFEWLEEFSQLTPILVEDNLQTISIGGNSKTIQPSLHYNVGGKRVILRIDKRYGVPVKIEFEDSTPIDFRETYFDTMVLHGKQEKISASWIEYEPVSEYWLQGVSS